MENISDYYGFIAAVILLTLTPGADTVFILTKSVSGGMRNGIASVLGITAGLFIHTALAAFGLSVLLMTSALLFTSVKILGAAYLVYLGIMSIRSKEKLDFAEEYGHIPFFTIFRQGFLTNILNPKVALFFLALLPQFVKSNAAGPIPFLILGITFICIGMSWSFILVWFSAGLSEKLRKSKFSVYLNKAAGVVFIALGLNILRIKN